ncbi:MAG: sugar transferase [bacterium]|nr:sugar transferase [bacterium]
MRFLRFAGLLLLLDLLVLEAAFYGIFWWRFQTGVFVNPVLFEPAELFVPSLIVSGFWLLHLAVFGLYRFDPLESRAVVVRRAAHAAFYGCLIIFVATFEPANPLPITRVVLVTYGIGVMMGIAVSRLALLTVLKELRIRGFYKLRTVVIGSGERLRATLSYLTRNRGLGADVRGVIGEHVPDVDAEYWGSWSEIRDRIQQTPCDLAYIALDEADERRLNRIVLLLSQSPVRQFIPADQYQILLGSVKPVGQRGLPIVEIRPLLLTPIEGLLKRLFDIVSAVTILVLSSPLWLLAILLTLVDSGRPVFFTQIRAGLNGRPFTIMKFRSMIQNAERGTGPVLATRGDARITKVGKFLRATRIDELPQLFNVLLGHMSIVGPRPERPEFVDEFARRAPLFLRRLNVKPGLTGWAQVHLQYDATIVAPEKKLEMDLYYIENMSLPLDIKILYMTLFVVLRGEG